MDSGPGQRVDWGTPADLFDLLHGIFCFELDVCAEQHNAKLARYWSPEDDGLVQPWESRNWCNPPYGRGIGAWLERAALEVMIGNSTVMLLPARTGTLWWRTVWADATWICWLYGRLTFEGAPTCAQFPSALVGFGRFDYMEMCNLHDQGLGHIQEDRHKLRATV